jgi:hypothetical protein
MIQRTAYALAYSSQELQITVGLPDGAPNVLDDDPLQDAIMSVTVHHLDPHT